MACRCRFEKGLFMKIPGCPLLRPLHVHWPTWKVAPWGAGEMPGFVEGVATCCHFAQPNSLEFQCGIEWRTLMLRHSQAKRTLNAEHAAQLATVMHTFCQVIRRLKESLCRGVGEGGKKGGGGGEDGDNLCHYCWMDIRCPASCCRLVHQEIVPA